MASSNGSGSEVNLTVRLTHYVQRRSRDLFPHNRGPSRRQWRSSRATEHAECGSGG